MAELFQTSTMETEGLLFFGKMSASISHELKNTISIMNESAGLLEDLSAIAEKGGGLDTAKVKRLSATIKHQIKRTDDIIRNMNRFSHLVDEPFGQIETASFLRLVIEITRRLTASAGVTVSLEDDGKPLHITTRPFYLHYLLWMLIQYCIKAAGVKGELKLTPKPAGNNGVYIFFSGLEKVPDEPEQHFLEQGRENLILLLGAKIHGRVPEKALHLFLPETLEK